MSFRTLIVNGCDMSEKRTKSALQTCKTCRQRFRLNIGCVEIYVDTSDVRWAFVKVTCYFCLEYQPSIGGFMGADEIEFWMQFSDGAIELPVDEWPCREAEIISDHLYDIRLLSARSVDRLMEKLDFRLTAIPEPKRLPLNIYTLFGARCIHCEVLTVLDPDVHTLMWYPLIMSAAVDLICCNMYCSKPIHLRLTLEDAIYLVHPDGKGFHYNIYINNSD